MRGAAYALAPIVVSFAATGALAASPAIVPVPIGSGKLYHPDPNTIRVGAQQDVAGLACSRSLGERFGAHLELFGHGKVVLVPAGIGIAPPLRADGPFVTGGACSYPARTREPTGVIEVAHGPRITLRNFFALWGQPLDLRRLAGFYAVGSERVRAWVNGRRWRSDPGAIPLRPHDEIVLELGGFVEPHASYRFRKGL
jgi:hypothetical protein